MWSLVSRELAELSGCSSRLPPLLNYPHLQREALAALGGGFEQSTGLNLLDCLDSRLYTALPIFSPGSPTDKGCVTFESRTSPLDIPG